MSKNDGNVSKFYSGVGWRSDGTNTEDAIRFEDLRDCAKEYVSKCRLRVLNHIPDHGDNLLDMASGPIQYSEYLEYSRNFKKRYCVDFSQDALVEANRKIGHHGEYCQGDFLDMDFADDFFDCSISLHTIYHIDKDHQEKAVRKLLDVTKPDAPVIIVYSNPNTLIGRFGKLLRNLSRLFKRSKWSATGSDDQALYFFTYSIDWWERFKDVADIKILPWRSLNSHHQKLLIPDNRFGKNILSFLYSMENRFPSIFIRNFQYSMIILRKSMPDKNRC